ncbi:MAG: hypothetical protein LBC86_00770 [Oscillospiraceae bacterium]|nr:hypothetical protein [Oscillospiraceae bacterium]
MKRLFIVMAVLGAIIIVTCLVAGASPMMYFIFIGMLVVIGIFLAPLFKQADEMLASGKIINRDANFMENVQRFNLSKVSQENLIAAMKKEGLPFAGLEWKTGDGVMGFKYADWTAKLIKLDGDDNSDRYEFGFLNWQTNKYGGSVTFTQMNQLLTAIEKAFIKLDPNTKVQTERGKIKTKSSFF